VREVIGGHACGVASGLAAYHLLATGLIMTAAMEPFSSGLLYLAASGSLSVAMTAGSRSGARRTRARLCNDPDRLARPNAGALGRTHHPCCCGAPVRRPRPDPAVGALSIVGLVVLVSSSVRRPSRVV
jgi:hypothetical protein